MNLVDHLLHPQHCFCNIGIENLEKWFTKHYVDGVSTLELLDSTTDASEKEAICVVAMFELGEESMLEMMGDVNMPEHHIIHCREHFKKELEERLNSPS
jgi:hypothetical protein